MHASQVYLKKHESSQSPLQRQLWTVSDQPLDKQAAKDLHRLSFPQKSIQWFWQTFTMFWSQMKEKKWNKTDKACNPTSHNTKALVWQMKVISRCFCGRNGTAVLSKKCNWCLLSEMNSRGAMWAMWWFYTASLKNLLDTSQVLIKLLAGACVKSWGDKKTRKTQKVWRHTGEKVRGEMRKQEGELKNS